MNLKKQYTIIAVIAAALGAVLVASSAQASALDTTTRGNWIGTYGNAGYVINDYNGGASLYTGDIVSYPTYVTGYTYADNYLTFQAHNNSLVGYPADLQNPTIIPTPALNAPTDLRSEGIVYSNVTTPMTISFDLKPNAKPFELDMYNLYVAAGSGFGFQIDLTYGSDPAIIDSKHITVAQEQAGTWAIFNLVPNGATLLNITVTPTLLTGQLIDENSSAFSGFFFNDGGLYIPEPSTVMLLGMGGFIVWLRRRNR